jgi:N-acetylmuramoyl-L-alanine amidase
MAGTDLGTIVLDPGHGGAAKLGGSSPNNAVSISGAKEKDLALTFCKALKAQLESQAAAVGDSVKVVMTRTTDVNVGITARAGVAGANNARLFLSLHFNGNSDSSIRGVETFFAAAANGNTNEADDKKFAEAAHKGLLDGMKSIDPTAKDRKVKPDTDTGPGRLGTLNDVSLGNSGRPKKCRAAYFEAEFITNPKVENLLISGPSAAANQRKVMGAVAKEMIGHLRTMP